MDRRPGRIEVPPPSPRAPVARRSEPMEDHSIPDAPGVWSRGQEDDEATSEACFEVEQAAMTPLPTWPGARQEDAKVKEESVRGVPASPPGSSRSGGDIGGGVSATPPCSTTGGQEIAGCVSLTPPSSSAGGQGSAGGRGSRSEAASRAGSAHGGALALRSETAGALVVQSAHRRVQSGLRCGICRRSPEQVKWASYDVRVSATGEETEVPAEDACEDCLLTVQWGFPLLTWTKAVAMSQGEPNFRLEVLEGTEVRLGRKRHPDAPERVQSLILSGLRVEKVYTHLTTAEFAEEFLVTPEDSGAPMCDIEDEEGELVRGRLVAGGGLSRGRRVVVWQERQEHFALENMPSALHLRGGQGRDSLTALRRQVLADRARPLRADVAIPTAASLRSSGAGSQADAQSYSAPAREASTEPRSRPLAPPQGSGVMVRRQTVSAGPLAATGAMKAGGDSAVPRDAAHARGRGGRQGASKRQE